MKTDRFEHTDSVKESKMKSDSNNIAIVGTYVESLFPSLRDIEVARIARQAVEGSGVEFGYIDYDCALKY